MDTRTGDIVPGGLLDELIKKAKEHPDSDVAKRLDEFTEMLIPPTDRQLKALRVGRNDPCPCGSDKKFKKCCLILDREAEDAS